MLTVEFIQKQESLKGLTPEQIQLIAQLSERDEDIVVGAKVSEMYGKFDGIVKTVTGKDKPANVKTYDHVETEFKALKTQAEGSGNIAELQKKVDELTAANTDLQQKITSGSTDAALKSQLETVKQQLTDKTNELNTAKTAFETEKQTLQNSLNTYKETSTATAINQQINDYQLTNKIAFKSTIPSDDLKVIQNSRRSAFIASLKPDYTPDGNGGQTLVFRDDKGEIMYNKTTLKPMTAGELYAPKIQDLIDVKKTQTGTGTGKDGLPKPSVDIASIGTATTQVQADEIIEKHLLEVEGLTKLSPEFAEKQMTLRTEHAVEKLPVRESAQ